MTKEQEMKMISYVRELVLWTLLRILSWTAKKIGQPISRVHAHGDGKNRDVSLTSANPNCLSVYPGSRTVWLQDRDGSWCWDMNRPFTLVYPLPGRTYFITGGYGHPSGLGTGESQDRS